MGTHPSSCPQAAITRFHMLHTCVPKCSCCRHSHMLSQPLLVLQRRWYVVRPLTAATLLLLLLLQERDCHGTPRPDAAV